MREIQIRHNYHDIAIVAHSMGGLVSRGAILKYLRDTQRNDVKVFVSINSPFGGDIKSRNIGTSPVVLPPSFTDMGPESAYMTWLLYEDEKRTHFKRLPGGVPHHMIMGFKGSVESCNDGTVSCVSQFHPEVQHHSASVRAWNFTHLGILREERTSLWISQILKDTFY
jgi:pimeloyl-ACP methyl ester carboxylesterase